MRGDPRAVAIKNIQKQLMQDWFPGYVYGDA